jgi:hypothetical protein
MPLSNELTALVDAVVGTPGSSVHACQRGRTARRRRAIDLRGPLRSRPAVLALEDSFLGLGL